MNLHLALTKQQKLGIVSVILVTFSIISYVYFVQVPSVKVKGSTSTSSLQKSSVQPTITLATPVPSQTIVIGADSSSQSKSQILESAKSSQELQIFYKNYFSIENWILVEESTQDSLTSLEFMQGPKTVKITISESQTILTQSNAKQPVLINVQEFL